jgi:glycosyltransferase involved in cell wall biosynthesis
LIMKLTIGIKALNEERHIAAALASAVKAAAPFGGEVVLADSGSKDRTIEIARTFPVRIVQLENYAERSPGAGAQLAFQYARGEFFYLLDGDMVIDPDFLPEAMAYIEGNPKCGGVGGRVIEMNTEGQEFQIRANTVARDKNWLPGKVDRLDCGGLYRVSAVKQSGFFADRNLHAFEEFDLGARLQSYGWQLARIDKKAVEHYGHTLDGYKLLWKRMKSGYSGAPGEVLRASLFKRHMLLVLARLGHIRHGLTVIAWWVILLACAVLPLSLLGLDAYDLPENRIGAIAALILAPLLLLTIRRGSLHLGLYSITAWNVSALGLISGFFRRRVSPRKPLASVVLSDPG